MAPALALCLGWLFFPAEFPMNSPSHEEVSREELAEALRTVLAVALETEDDQSNPADPSLRRAQSLLARYDNEGGG